MCIWVGFQRCKIVLDYRGIYLNMEDENNFLNEYLTLDKLNLNFLMSSICMLVLLLMFIISLRIQLKIPTKFKMSWLAFLPTNSLPHCAFSLV
jgi:hypothetical protein